MNINSVFAGLYQMGIGPSSGFVADISSKWSDFTTNTIAIELLKTYMYYKVRIQFDPPTNSIHLESMNKQLQDCEFRIRTFVDWGGEDDI